MSKRAIEMLIQIICDGDDKDNDGLRNLFTVEDLERMCEQHDRA